MSNGSFQVSMPHNGFTDEAVEEFRLRWGVLTVPYGPIRRELCGVWRFWAWLMRRPLFLMELDRRGDIWPRF